MKLILSIFPGIDLLGRAFEEAGFCVVRGPDLLWGGDIRRFDPPAGVFWGVIGGPPCQDFSGLRRTEPTGYGLSMLTEYARVVIETQPEWWLMENVARTPDLTSVVTLPGYVTQRLDIDNAWLTDQSRRLRHIQFGSKSGRLLNVTRSRVTATTGAALANDNRSFDELKRLQGLPDDYDLPGFLVKEKIRAVGNGVPLPMGRVLARAVTDAYSKNVTVQVDLFGDLVRPDVCSCGCGRHIAGKKIYYDYSCRKRAERKRRKLGKAKVKSACADALKPGVD